MGFPAPPATGGGFSGVEFQWDSRQTSGYYNPVPGVNLIHNGFSPDTLAADRIYWLPVVLIMPITITGAACNIATGAAGNVRCGVYAADDLWVPAGLVGDSGDVSAGVGLRESSALSWALEPGRYLFAHLQSSAPTVRNLLYFTQGGPAWRFGGGFGNTSFDQTQLYVSRSYSAHAYGALPASPAAQTAGSGSTAAYDYHPWLYRWTTP